MELHLLLAFFLFLVSQESFLFLGGLAVFSSFTSFANLKTAGLSLVGEHFAASLLSLLLVDELHQDTLVLENVTWRQTRVQLRAIQILAKEYYLPLDFMYKLW